MIRFNIFHVPLNVPFLFDFDFFYLCSTTRATGNTFAFYFEPLLRKVVN